MPLPWPRIEAAEVQADTAELALAQAEALLAAQLEGVGRLQGRLGTLLTLCVTLGWAASDACAAALKAEAHVVPSAGTLAEAHVVPSAGTLAEAPIVAARRGHGGAMADLIAALDAEVPPATAAGAERAAAACDRRGTGVHPAAPNSGDCFACAVAHRLGCPLLYVGRDFARAGVAACLP